MEEERDTKSMYHTCHCMKQNKCMSPYMMYSQQMQQPIGYPNMMYQQPMMEQMGYPMRDDEDWDDGSVPTISYGHGGGHHGHGGHGHYGYHYPNYYYGGYPYYPYPPYPYYPPYPTLY